ncbi:immunity protein Imm33 domain-containing protein [Novosphingobium sp. B 225]|uniref:immunity protein Imm33 domain-containing protein n=1 Tax=Novosphingobium sp. B 225 TaxID=1961849 RepID=UPI000B4C08B2|nr:DUF2185 domain-containing protein [Novosphingobium sp. B 225]
MGLRGLLRDWRSKRFGTWNLDDPRPIAAGAPYTFYLPSEDMVRAIAAGDMVKAIFRPDPPDRKFGAERMWVEVDSVDGDDFVGRLVNTPTDIPQLPIYTSVRVPRSHVIDIEFAEGRLRPEEPTKRWYWERCLVDACVLDGRSNVDYLYREDDDLGQPDDKYPDSGWRIRGTDEGIAEDERLEKAPQYVAIGPVLNQDDRWLRLIDEPVGSRFIWSGPDRAFITAGDE